MNNIRYNKCNNHNNYCTQITLLSFQILTSQLLCVLSNTVPDFLARECVMKRFISEYQNLFLGKTPVVLIALILLGSLIGGGFILHTMNHTSSIGNCSSSPVQAIASSSSQGCAKVISHHQPQASVQIHSNIKGEVVGSEIVSIPRQVAPTPTPYPQPVKMYPTPVPTIPYPTSPGQGAVIAMINQVFGSYAAGALNIARCEFGFNPLAYNPISIGGSHAEGIFQILFPSTWSGTSEASSSPYSAMANILAAHQIFVRDGYSWREWSCAA